jgi:prepilin-type N-terminal cleavage/methylation domain-containing protein/prepilin-type processing-associated H-X9-DG protein
MQRRLRRAFTFVELMVVIGLISMLASLMLPVLGKMRSAARSTVCTSNLRVLGQAWAMYTSENHGRLMQYVWQAPTLPDSAWRNYWLGIIDTGAGVRGASLLCPSASEISANAAARGYGSATTAWTGRYTAGVTGISFNATTYRSGSYGYNRNLTAGGGFGPDGNAKFATAIANLADVPMFFDCAYPDVRPPNGTQIAPVEPPPDLRGATLRPGQPEHWNILLARHGRGVNVCMGDGRVTWVQLEDLYSMTWKSNWNKYRLVLPVR